MLFSFLKGESHRGGLPLTALAIKLNRFTENEKTRDIRGESPKSPILDFLCNLYLYFQPGRSNSPSDLKQFLPWASGIPHTPPFLPEALAALSESPLVNLPSLPCF